jgi:hypothetical protein
MQVTLIYFLPPRPGLSAAERWRHRTLAAVIDQPDGATSAQVLARWLAEGGYPPAQAVNYAADSAPVTDCPPA